MLAKAPAPNAPAAHPSSTEATANPVPAVLVPKAGKRAQMLI
jgi:hypothetical protein